MEHDPSIERVIEGNTPPVSGSAVAPEVAWSIALEQLQGEMAIATFDNLLLGSRLVRVSAKNDRETFHISVKSESAAEWLSTRLAAQVKRTLSQTAGRPIDTVFMTEVANLPPAPLSMPEPPPTNGNKQPPAVPPQKQLKKRGRKIQVPEMEPMDIDAVIRKDTNRDRERADPVFAYVPTQHYAHRFWRPYLGSVAFDLWEVLRSYEYFVTRYHSTWPSITILCQTVDADRKTILGRPGQPGAIHLLEERGLCRHCIEGEGRQQSHIFTELIDDLPLLTPTQTAILSAQKRREHDKYLGYYNIDLDKWRRLKYPTLVTFNWNRINSIITSLYTDEVLRLIQVTPGRKSS